MSSRPTSVEAAQGLVHIAEGHLLLRLTLIDLFEALDHSRIEIGLRRLRRFKVGKRVIERDWLIIKLLPHDIADERVLEGMIGASPFPLLGRRPHRRVRSTIDAIPNFPKCFVDKMCEAVVVGAR